MAYKLKMREVIENMPTKDLSEWEFTFFSSLHSSWEKYGRGMKISAKQKEHLNKLIAKYFVDFVPSIHERMLNGEFKSQGGVDTKGKYPGLDPFAVF